MRWYLRNELSYRDREELLAERGVEVDQLMACSYVVVVRVGRGRAPLLSDSELITLAVAQVLQGYH